MVSGGLCSRGIKEISRWFTERHERSRLEGMASMREQNMSVWDLVGMKMAYSRTILRG